MTEIPDRRDQVEGQLSRYAGKHGSRVARSFHARLACLARVTDVTERRDEFGEFPLSLTHPQRNTQLQYSRAELNQTFATKALFKPTTTRILSKQHSFDVLNLKAQAGSITRLAFQAI